ncbi:hypothetical protein H5410_002153 [Solanum commersonii]|uniref:Uncharacterized protein n=1 Tax=Solanum commersonii TaxID=4109 RepID=A0A9J6B194_SOLCO|nr:hypothetical protein H5410_002153 [Solanum commersonii]
MQNFLLLHFITFSYINLMLFMLWSISYSRGIHESCTNYLFIIGRVKYHPTFALYASGIFFTRKSKINSTCEFGKCHPAFSCICIQYFIGKSTINSNSIPQCVSSQRYDGMVIWSISSSNHNHPI